MSAPTPRRLWRFVTERLQLSAYLRAPSDGRVQPQIPAAVLLWALLVGHVLREWTFHGVEALVRSSARRALRVGRGFGDDALAYFTERLDPAATRQAVAATVRRAKRNKALGQTGWIGLAIDGTGAGRCEQEGCALCHPVRDSQGESHGYLHHFEMVSVVGTGLTLPFDVEPYGPGDCEYVAGQRLLQRAVADVGRRAIRVDAVGRAKRHAFLILLRSVPVARRSVSCVGCPPASRAKTVSRRYPAWPRADKRLSSQRSGDQPAPSSETAGTSFLHWTNGTFYG